VKTKILKQRPGKDGKLPYAGVPDCFRKSIANEGLSGLWSGYRTFYCHLGPHTIIVLLAAEQFKHLLGVNQA
jgi:hypothetical protein